MLEASHTEQVLIDTQDTEKLKLFRILQILNRVFNE